MDGQPFAKAQIQRFTHSRKHAETAVETALLVCEARNVTDEQLADLADAVDALRAGQYHAAVVLAEAAIEGRRRPATALRPAGMARSLAECRLLFGEMRSGDS